MEFIGYIIVGHGFMVGLAFVVLNYYVTVTRTGEHMRDKRKTMPKDTHRCQITSQLTLCTQGQHKVCDCERPPATSRRCEYRFV